MSTSKRNTYEQGIARIDEALDHEFWLEASWIVYSMFEDRCDSLLDKSGGPLVPSRPGHFVSINAKINELKNRATTDQFLSQVADLKDLLDEVYDWKESRNPVMHSLVEEAREWCDINSDAKVLAKEGREILGRFATAAMKVRRKYKRAGN